MKEISLDRKVIEEWNEHPVTEWFVDALMQRAEDAQTTRMGVLFPGEPYRTQEAIVGLEHVIAELRFLNAVLKAEWDEGESCPLDYLIPEEVEDE